LSVQGAGPSTIIDGAGKTAIQAYDLPNLIIKKLKVQNCVQGIHIDHSRATLESNIHFGPNISECCVLSAGLSLLSILYDYTITAASPKTFLQSQVCSSIIIWDMSLTLSGTPEFRDAFVMSHDNSSIIRWGNMSFFGTATGKRYAAAGGFINTGGAGENFFPGNQAGYATMGGIYA
jgi:hypothetical protein